MPALRAASAIVLAGRLTPAQVAEHNAFITATQAGDSFASVDAQSRFVGITRGLVPSTTI